MSENIEDSLGMIIPNKVKKISDKMYTNLENQKIIFQPKDIAYKGYIRWYGEINGDVLVYGIEMNPIKMGTDGTFNNHKIFSCSNETGVLIKRTHKILEIDDIKECIISESPITTAINHSENKYQPFDIIVVKIQSNCRVGEVIESRTLNYITCYVIKFKDDVKHYTYASFNISGKFTNEYGIVFLNEGTFKISEGYFDCRLSSDGKFSLKADKENLSGKLIKKIEIDGYKCILIESGDENLAKDYFDMIKMKNAHGILICLDIKEKKIFPMVPDGYQEINNPEEVRIYTYYKKQTSVKFEEQEGIVENYAVNSLGTFYYVVKLFKNNELKCIPINELKSAFPIQIRKGFHQVQDPLEYGIITKFKIDDYVIIKSTKENNLGKNCCGKICWMGFDNNFSFKFLIHLEESHDEGHSGIIFGESLCPDIGDRQGLLTYPSCVTPFCDDSPPSVLSEIVTDYIQPRYKMPPGYGKGIQGDRNSCYMDTSLLAMFTFQEVFDNILYVKETSEKQISDLQTVLCNYIIFPLRRHGFVSYDRVKVFREKLGEIFPDKNFLINEKDPEELLESLFHLLTPKNPLLNTFHYKSGTKQECFLTQLFYVTNDKIGSTVNVGDMLNWTFLESDILIDKPPKCLILQLPRHGVTYKNYKEVNISSKLDITHLVRHCENLCSCCSKYGNFFCKACTETYSKFFYFCQDHRFNCKHEKFNIISSESTHVGTDTWKASLFKGKVVLQLFAVLCIEKTHYIAYVKTGELTHKWIYFDSMATIENGEMKPLIREVDINKYFESGDESGDCREDILRIKNYAFICFYKNPTLEFYFQDFNYTG